MVRPLIAALKTPPRGGRERRGGTTVAAPLHQGQERCRGIERLRQGVQRRHPAQPRAIVARLPEHHAQDDLPRESIGATNQPRPTYDSYFISGRFDLGYVPDSGLAWAHLKAVDLPPWAPARTSVSASCACRSRVAVCPVRARPRLRRRLPRPPQPKRRFRPRHYRR